MTDRLLTASVLRRLRWLVVLPAMPFDVGESVGCVRAALFEVSPEFLGPAVVGIPQVAEPDVAGVYFPFEGEQFGINAHRASPLSRRSGHPSSERNAGTEGAILGERVLLWLLVVVDIAEIVLAVVAGAR